MVITEFGAATAPASGLLKAEGVGNLALDRAWTFVNRSWDAHATHWTIWTGVRTGS